MSRGVFYHAVTGRPMQPGQQILITPDTPNGVYTRVMEKMPAVQEIYAHPENYNAEELEHHTRVALRELALEKVRVQHFKRYPSRMHCLYVSESLAEAEKWAGLFAERGRPTFSVVRLELNGEAFTGDAWNCFQASVSERENLEMAERYWLNLPNMHGEAPIRETLISGEITVAEIVREINKNC